ncbi:hypothetical protein ACFE04_030862 [Oxalis oulophora]
MNTTTIYKPPNPTTTTLTLTPTTPKHPSQLFPILTKCKTIKHLTQIHSHFIKTGLIQDPLAAAELLKFSCLFNSLHYASALFRQMGKPNCFSYNTLIRAYVDSGDDDISDSSEEGIRLFVDMLCDDFVEVNKFTFPSVLKACALSKRVSEGKQLHGLVVKFGFESDEFVVSNLLRMYVMCGFMDDGYSLFGRRKNSRNVVMWNVMVDGYLRFGDFTTAKTLFDRMPKRSVVSWNGMISGFAQNGFFKEALDLFHDMQVVGGDVCPNYVTLVSVLPAISHLGALELGKWVHLYAEKKGIEIDDKFGSALVDMYSKCGSIEKAIQVFESLPKRNTITWSSIIGGLAMNGRANEALHYFSRMEKAGVKPNDALFTGILSACSHAGLVKEGRYFFDKISICGLEPKIEHYGCIVDLLGRAGLLEEAEEFTLTMPIKPDDVIWKSLLGACKIHGNIEMGERIANVLMDLAPKDSGSYIALSNMYASTDNWDGVSRVRLKMKEMDIRKDPGCSWIELDGTIHEFLVEDDSHPRAKEIHSMLKEISEKLKQSPGYRPNIKQVLLNMDEDEKESVLHYHSEKIAVAFGLISTSPGTPLRIVKNLRICEDCHSSMKLISTLYERKITVRDRKRFHHFEHGSCSCRDYW